jgi:tRNA(Phe) wybutosine-synthesizing methylase Tyw3
MQNFFKNNGKNEKTAVQINAAQYVDISVLWRVGQETTKTVTQKTKDLALSCLVDILNKTHANLKNLHTKMDFFQKSIENLQNEKSVHTTLLFIKRLLLTFPLDSGYLA